MCFEIDKTQFYVVGPGTGGVCRAPDAADAFRGRNKTMARKDEQWAPGGVMNCVFCKGLEQLPCQGAAVGRKLQVTTGALQPCTGSGAREEGASDILNCFQKWFVQSGCQRGG